MSLQLALTQLESLAELLNERKRETEQYQAFRDTLRRVSGKFTLRPLADNNRYLLRQDNAHLVVKFHLITVDREFPCRDNAIIYY